MVPFAGWEMPVQYSGVVDEHTTVRTAVGLFDVSHMGEVEFRGPKAWRRSTGSSPTT
jgi:aminomethyltransferase